MSESTNISDGSQPVWAYTEHAAMEARKHGLYEERGIISKRAFYGTGSERRPVIHRDSKINGGVYIGVDYDTGEAREAIVVDDKTDNGDLNRSYQNLLKDMRSETPQDGLDVLVRVYDRVRRDIP